MATILKYASAVTSLLSSSASTVARAATTTTAGIRSTATTVYSAITILIAEFIYNRPGGVDIYYRPDGTSKYLHF